jgi:DNA polymerase-1
MKNDRTLYLIDGSAYIYRAYHAIRSLANSKGLPTNAAFGFTRMLIKLIEDRSPEYVVMFFDAKGPTFRHEIYQEYKANRPPMPEDLSIQIPYIKEITHGFNIPVIEMQGFEADDLIGTFRYQAEKAGFFVVMVTGDKDFVQLVTDNAVIWDPMKEKTIDIKTVRDDFGVEPYQMIDVMALSGDASDNVPGVPGIGPKTALSLIKTFGTVERLYERVHTITKKKQHENLVQYKEQAFMSKELVKINIDVPFPFNPENFNYKTPDNTRLSKLFKNLEFRQLQQAFPKRSDLSNKNYRAIYDMSVLFDLIERLKKAETFAIDTETTSKDPMKANLVGLSFSMEPDEAFYIPCAHDYPEAPEQLELKKVLSQLKPVLENPDVKKIGQNIKYDWMVLKRHGINLAGVIFDTMLASYLINPSKRAHNLDQIAIDFLDHKTTTYKEISGKGKKDVSFSEISLEKAVPYSCEDADITLMAYHVLMPLIDRAGLMELYNNVELPLVPVLMNMEMTGVCVEKEKLVDLSKSFENQLEQLESMIYLINCWRRI